MFMVAVAYVIFRNMNIYKFETENKLQINRLETEIITRSSTIQDG